MWDNTADKQRNRELFTYVIAADDFSDLRLADRCLRLQRCKMSTDDFCSHRSAKFESLILSSLVKPVNLYTRGAVCVCVFARARETVSSHPKSTHTEPLLTD